MTKVPFVDLKAQYAPIQADIEADVLDVLRSWWVVGGPYLDKFEAEFAQYLGVTRVVGCASGTSALDAGMRAIGIGEGDKVIVPVNSFIASANAVLAAGATPVFVDVDPETYLMDLGACEELLQTDRTIKGIMVVHLYGQMVDMLAYSSLAKAYGVKLIEDAAQAVGANFSGYGVGALSDVAGTSFYPAKNLGTCGQGGAIITNSAEAAVIANEVIHQGSKTKYEHVRPGYNFALDSLMAAQLRHALRILDSNNDGRRRVAARYDEAFGERAPWVDSRARHIYHLYEYRCDDAQDRQALMDHLGAEGVACGLHYPSLIVEAPHFKQDLKLFPVASQLKGQLLSLPMFPTMSDTQIDAVIAAVNGFRNN